VPVELTRYGVPGWGVGEIWTEGEVLVAHDFAFGSERANEKVGGGTAHDLAARFTAYLAGFSDDFRDVEIDAAWNTPFQRAVTETLRRVPRGEVVSYGELAALAGYPRAGRAVGTYCAGCRFDFVVPCHRVIAADGIGGYGAAGVEVKRALLALEGTVL